MGLLYFKTWVCFFESKFWVVVFFESQTRPLRLGRGFFGRLSFFWDEGIDNCRILCVKLSKRHAISGVRLDIAMC